MVAAAMLVACGDAKGDQEAPDRRPVVSVVTLASATAPGAVRASGKIGYRREPALAFTAPGVIGAIDVDVGDVVRRGQRLATLRRTTVGANPNEGALARLNAERDLRRTQRLFDEGFVSQARLEDARLAVERANDSAALTAPADGVILRRNAEPSQIVSAGAPVLALGETASGIVVRAPVPSAAAARIKVGDAARVRTPELGADVREGRVTRIGAKGDDFTGAFEVEIEIVSPQGLRSGMVAEADIAAAGAEAQAVPLVAPALSLLDARADQGIVFVVDAGGVARRRAVRTAGVTNDGVLIVEGVTPGERIVGAGAAYVRDGERVRIAAGAEG